MNIKKIVTAIIITVLISAGLYYGVAAMSPTEAIKAALTTRFDLTMCVILGAVVGAAYLAMSYSVAGIKDETVLKEKKQEYIYNMLTDEEKQTVDNMTSEDKDKFYSEYENKLDNSKKTAITNHLFDLQKNTKPSSIKALGRAAVLGVIALYGYIGYDAYNAAKPALDEYNAIKTATYDDQVLNIEGLPPIQLVSGGTFKQSYVNDFIEKNIKKLPNKVLAAHSMIVIYSPEEFEKVKIKYARETYVDGFALGDLTTHLSINCRKSIVSHEASHVYDFLNGNCWASTSKEFQNLWQTYKGSFKFPGVDNDYCNNDSAEFFAESGKLFIDEPEYLKKNCEPLYSYFDKLYN